MKLHGWEQPDQNSLIQSAPTTPKTKKAISNWLIGRLDENDKFSTDFNIKDIADLADQFSKFKKDANFMNLENLTGNGYYIHSL